MPQARDIIAIKVLIRAHFLLTLSPKPTGYFALVWACDFKVLISREVDVWGEGVPALAFALGFGDGGRVERFEVCDEFGEEVGIGGLGVLGNRGFIDGEAWCCGYCAGGVMGWCATSYP
jgi:hypothetical protein